jgi:single-strand DNA-binding protein
LNKFIALGNLTRDPESRTTKSGKNVTNFSIAINNKVNDTVTYIDIETWNKSADNCKRFLSKGRRILVEGRLQLNTWKSKSGENRSKIYCVADSVTFLSKSEQDPSAKEPHQPKPEQQEEEDEFADVPF